MTSLAVTEQLVVLVGGKGTRLGAHAHNVPKPLMAITEDKVFLDYVLASAARQGFRSILLLAGHLGAQVVERYHGRAVGGANIHVVVEPEPLGTGGALRSAAQFLQDTFVVTNGDTLFDINIRRLDVGLLEDPHALGVLALRRVEDVTRYGRVSIDVEGRIEAFLEKDASAVATGGLINGGVYVLRREILDGLPDGKSSLELDLFPDLTIEKRLRGLVFEGYFIDMGLPETLEQARSELPHRSRPALFLDRDGVVNQYKPYMYRIEDFEWVDGAIEVIRRRNDLGHAVIVVTNQSGIGRGYFSEDDLETLHGFIQKSLNAKGAFIDAFYACPYHAEAKLPQYRAVSHPDRKPNPGMIYRAAREAQLDLSQAVLIGDRDSDVEAAHAAGIKGLIFPGGDLFAFEQVHLFSLRV